MSELAKIRAAVFSLLGFVSWAWGAEALLSGKQDQAFFRSRGISFYASMDESLTADYAYGRAEPVEPLFPPAYRDQKISFVEGKYGKCAQGKSLTLIYAAMKNFFPDRGGVSFWFRPHAGNLWTLFMVQAREHGVGPNSRRQMDLYYATFLFGTSPILRSGFYRALIRPVFDAIDAQFTLEDLSRDEWHHFVWTWDNTQGMRVYLDGEEVFDNWGTTSWIQMMTPNLVELKSIQACDEVLLFRRPLQPDEALNLYRGKLPEPREEEQTYIIPEELRRDIAHCYGLDEMPVYPIVKPETPTVFTPVNFSDARDGRRPYLYCLDGDRVSCWPLSHIEVVNTDKLDIYYPPGTKANYFKVIADGTRFSLTKNDEAEPFWVDEVRPELDGWEDKLVRRYVAEKPLTLEKLTLDRKGARIGEFYVYHVEEREFAIPGSTRQELLFATVRDVRDLERIGGRYQLFHNHPSPAAIAVSEVTKIAGKLDYNALVPFHIATEPFAEQTGVAAMTLTLACTRPPGKQEAIVRLRIPDPITKERDLINVDFRLGFDPQKEGPQTFRLSLDMRDIVMNEGSRLWVWLVSKNGGTLALSQSSVTLHTVPVTKAAEEMVADALRLLKHSYQISSEPHQWTRSFKFAGDEEYHYEWPDWAALYNIIKHGLAPDNEVLGTYWNAIRPRTYRGYKTNEEAIALPYKKPQPPEEIPNPTNAPDWALYQNELLKVMLRIGQWWHDHRLHPKTGVLGGYGDDTQLTGEMFWLYFCTGDQKILNTLRGVSEGSWKYAGWYRSFPSRTNDIGHNAEEVSGAYPLMVLADYGNPRYLEWVMECMELIDFLTTKTGHGHRHIKSWYYSSTEIITKTTMGVDNFGNSSYTLIGHPLAWYSRTPKLVQFYRDWCDAWMEDSARAREAGIEGSFVVEMPEDTPVARGHHRPYTMPHQFMVTGLLTGDQKYIDRALHNDDKFFSRYYLQYGQGMLLRDFGFLRHLLLEDEKLSKSRSAVRANVGFGKFFKTGDKGALAESYKSTLMRYLGGLEYLYSEAQPSTDRLWGMSNETMYLAMLGGRPAGHRGSSNWPGLAISFTDAGTDLASLVLENRVNELAFLAYNFNKSRKNTEIRVWQLESGIYELSVGPDVDQDNVADVVEHRRTVEVRRGTRIRIPVDFAKLQVVRLKQIVRKEEPKLLPDLALSSAGITYDAEEKAVEVTVHNVGSVDAGPFTVSLHRKRGKARATQRVGELTAPVDLKPRRVTLTFPMVRKSFEKIHHVSLKPEQPVLEITDENNSVLVVHKSR